MTTGASTIHFGTSATFGARTARAARRLLIGVGMLALLAPSAVHAAGVQPLFDLGSPTTGPFPSDRFTVADQDQLTGRRVGLPTPDCAARPSDCADLDEINTLDGFNLQPRLSIPFNGPIDVTTVDGSTVFLVSVGSTVAGGRPAGHVVGVNQRVWDPDTNTLHAESDELLDQHTRYALIVTDGVRDPLGDRVEAGDFARFWHDLNFGQAKDRALKEYRAALVRALALSGVKPSRVVAASVFTTQSVTAILEKIRDEIKASTPAPADFHIGPGGGRTVFPASGVAGILFARQVKTAPAFATSPVITPLLGVVPGAVAQIALGKYTSPDYETPEKFMPPVATRTGTPAAEGTNEVFFNLFLPAGHEPPAGWPVAIFGHGITLDRHNTPAAVAAVMAAHGFATIAINAVGHGGGPLGTLTVLRTDGTSVTLPAGGRGIDQDGDGTIGAFEGLSAAPPRTIISYRDGLRQTVVDLMQLVRVIETGGIDVDGDGFQDLDPSRIYYLGQSLGGIYGTTLLAVDPSVRAGVPNVPGAPRDRPAQPRLPPAAGPDPRHPRPPPQ